MPGMKPLVHGIVLLIFVLLLVSAGCTNTAPAQPVTTVVTTPPLPVTATPAPTPLPPRDLEGNWQATTMAVQGGTAITNPTATITLQFMNDGNAYGFAGCNNYRATYTLTGTTTPKGAGLVFGPINVSQGTCQYGNQEEQYLGILQNAGAYVVDGGQLTMTDKNQNALIFQHPSTLPSPAGGTLPR